MRVTVLRLVFIIVTYFQDAAKKAFEGVNESIKRVVGRTGINAIGGGVDGAESMCWVV